jgi:hypothetical protein
MRRTIAMLLMTGVLTASMPLMARDRDRGGRDGGGNFNPIIRVIKNIIRHLLPLDDTNNINPPKP